MTTLFLVGCAITVLGPAGLLVAERKSSQSGKWATKPIASAGFLVAAVGAGALETVPGTVVVIGLALSMVGDIALIGRSRPAFLGGLVAFLLGHVAFAIAFALRSFELVPTLVGLGAVGVASGFVWRWVSPHVERPMRVPVAAYVLVISSMVATAAGAISAAHGVLGLVGAVMFYGSDLAVARDRFVAPGFSNRAWGLPLYYAAQLVIAASTAT
jgi:uncharacterized membrane protein YhhN